ncbi:MAG: hypothetical protein JWR09_2426 [Mucilaginibacter sp.]|nr:hypothetical protein [Mucilaginibacter sp.]
MMACGTFIISWGSLTYGDKGLEQVNQKLDTFQKKLNFTESSNLSPIEKQKKIDTIQNQFDTWAKNLKNNYDQIEINNEKQLLNKKEAKIKLQGKWNSLLNKAFSDILKMAASINKATSPNNIKIHIHGDQMTEHDFFIKKDPYFLDLEFKPNMVLTIYADVSPSPNPTKPDEYYVVIHAVSFNSILAKESQNTILLSFFELDDFNVEKHGNFTNLILKNEKSYYSNAELNAIVQEILSYQFALANKKN